MIEPNQNSKQAALKYLSLGLYPIPLFPREKRPILKDWTNLRLTADEISRTFPSLANIGILLGDPSNNLVDVDLDSTEAMLAAATFLPKTIQFGRADNSLPTHFFYVAKGEIAPKKFTFKTSKGKETIVEIRSNGQQTMVPPSIHPNGQPLVYSGSEVALSEIDSSDLSRAVALIAVTASISRVWPSTSGIRNDVSLALAGALFSLGASEKEAEKVISTAAKIANDEEWATRSKGVAPTYSKRSNGLPTTGIPSLAGMIGPELDVLVRTIKGHLGTVNGSSTNSRSSNNSSALQYELPDTIDFSNQGEPIPLYKKHAPSKPFPIPALGPIMSGAACSLRKVIQAPDAICAQSVLAAASFATQAHYNVLIDSRTIPLSLFFLSVAESGERKSSVDREALKASKEFESKLMNEFDIAFKKFLFDTKKYEANERSRQKNRKGFSEDEVKLPPVPPQSPIMFCTDPTYEGLAKQLAIGIPSTAVFSDEGGRLIGGSAFQKENQLKTAAAFSGLWDGSPIDRVRSGDGSSKIYNRRVALHLMLQPVVFREMMSNAIFREQGFLARCLVTYPEPTSGTRPYVDTDLTIDEPMNRYWERIRQIHEVPLPRGKSIVDGLSFGHLRLTLEAKARYIAFHDDIEFCVAPGWLYNPIKAFAAKVAEQAIRIAGVLHAFERPNIYGKISLDEMNRAIEICEYYLDEALRLCGMHVLEPEIELAEKLLDWLKRYAKTAQRTIFYASEIYKHGPNPLRNKKQAGKALEVLVDHRYLIKRTNVRIDEALRRVAWELNPKS